MLIGQAHRGLRSTVRRCRGFASMAIVAMLAAACAGTAPTPSPVPQPTNNNGPATPTANVSAAPDQTLAPGQLKMALGNAAPVAGTAQDAARAGAEINDFGFDLLRKLDAKGNLVASPTSIALALGMVRPGAKGVTGAEMDKVLHAFGNGQAAEVGALLKSLASKNVYLDANGMPVASPGPGMAPVVELDVADQAFAQQDYKFEQAYLDAIRSGFNAGVALVDYKTQAEPARLLINKWASDQTKGRIPNILGQGDVDSATRLVLVNAVYLKAAWEAKFDPKKTADRPFTTPAGVKQVSTMAIDAKYGYAEGAGYKAIDLPYSLGGLSMTIVVPDDLSGFTKTLTSSSFASILAAESEAEVDFQLPKFSLETRTELSALLAAMGMNTAFDAEKADFSGMTTEEKLFISAVIHQANIDVVEEGTTAAAVTAVVMTAGAAPLQPRKVTFHVDKPFLYFIHDAQSGAILFMGQVADPTAK